MVPGGNFVCSIKCSSKQSSSCCLHTLIQRSDEIFLRLLRQGTWKKEAGIRLHAPFTQHHHRSKYWWCLKNTQEPSPTTACILPVTNYYGWIGQPLMGFPITTVTRVLSLIKKVEIGQKDGAWSSQGSTKASRLCTVSSSKQSNGNVAYFQILVLLYNNWIVFFNSCLWWLH